MTQLQFKCRPDSLAIPIRREILHQGPRIPAIKDETGHIWLVVLNKFQAILTSCTGRRFTFGGGMGGRFSVKCG